MGGEHRINIMEHQDFVLGMLGVLILLGCAFFLLPLVMDRSELSECLKLQNQSNNFSRMGFYVTKHEHEMCLVHGIDIQPVKWPLNKTP